MKKKLVGGIAALVMLLSSLVGVVSTAIPAKAGQDSWTTDCNNNEGNPIWWYNQTGYYGTRYVHTWSGVVQGPFTVSGIGMDIYTQEGWQCGWMGAPVSQWGAGGLWYNQAFDNAWIAFSHEMGGCYYIQHRWSSWHSGCRP